MMNKLIKLFMSQYQLYLDPNNYYDCQQYPKRLIAQLDINNPDNMLYNFVNNLQNFKKRSLSGLQILHKLTTISLIMIHSDKFYQIFTHILPLDLQKCRQQDKWLKQTFLIPYQQFLLKCCTSAQIYSKVKRKNVLLLQPQIYNFDAVFYIINLLNKLFASLDKISQLARYYSQIGGYAPKLYVHVASLQALRLYVTLKTIVSQMVNFPGKYMPSRKQQKIMKTILGQYIIQINQQMKNILLNKYYTPYKQGIKTRLFRNQQQQMNTFKTINGILNSHRDTERQNQQKKRQQTMKEFSNIMNQSIQSSRSRQYQPKITQYSINMNQTLSQMSLMVLGSPLAPHKNMVNSLSTSNNDCLKSQSMYQPKKTIIIEHQPQIFNQQDEENSQNSQDQQQAKQKVNNAHLDDKTCNSTEPTASPAKNISDF